MRLTIQRLGYSHKPWRLVREDGLQVAVPREIDHANLGVIRTSMPIMGATRKECVDEALELLATLLAERGER